MKRIFATILATVFLTLSLSACGANNPSASMQENEAGQEEIRLLENLLDLTPYRENEWKIEANTIDEDLSYIDVNGTQFKLGMTYNEVLDLGFKPNREDFEDDKPTNTMARVDTFSNDDGETVRLGFAVSLEGYKAGATVKNGGFLYCIYTDSAFAVAGIDENCTPAQILNSLGEPYYIDEGCYSEYPDAGLQYFNNDANNKYVTFRVNLETNSITLVTLEGYID